MWCRMRRDVHAATQYIAVTPTYDELSWRVLQRASKGVRNHSPRPQVPSRSLTLACRRPPTAYAPASLRLLAAPEARRSASEVHRYGFLSIVYNCHIH